MNSERLEEIRDSFMRWIFITVICNPFVWILSWLMFYFGWEMGNG